MKYPIYIKDEDYYIREESEHVHTIVYDSNDGWLIYMSKDDISSNILGKEITKEEFDKVFKKVLRRIKGYKNGLLPTE